MSDEPQKLHFIVRNFDEHKRRESTRRCPLCQQEFHARSRLLDHAKQSHPDLAAQAPDGEEWKTFLETAYSKPEQRTVGRLVSETQEPRNGAHSSVSMAPNPDDEDRPASRPISAQDHPEQSVRRISEIKNLKIEQDPSFLNSSNLKPEHENAQDPTLEPAREVPDSRPSHRARKSKATQGLQVNTADDRALRSWKAGAQRLYHHKTDRTNFGYAHDSGPGGPTLFSDGILSSRTNEDTPMEDHSPIGNPGPNHETMGKYRDSRMEPEVKSTDPTDVLEGATRASEAEPELLLQPETKPVPYHQLVDEVKGIYAGLVMVEAKCIEVDEQQTMSATKGSSRASKLTPEQYSALIALHKTLLNEQHDFFLACQHPSATPAVKKLPAKYSMPARMWRHGIHAFLEVLRFRLPESLDHMLAFIYIAYSMTALLYETVPSFEDTWIECLGDLGRYRMAIEDDCVRDREIWSGVARSWYRMGIDRNPKVGRLNHHLAILARPYTIQQLSYYARALTCVLPFENARSSMMSLVTPILEGKDSYFARSIPVEILFIKAHGLLFTGKTSSLYHQCVDQLVFQGQADDFIKRMGLKFREGIGACSAMSCIAALFQFGEVTAVGNSKSILRLLFDAEQTQRESSNSKDVEQTEVDGKQSAKPRDSRSPKGANSNWSPVEVLSPGDLESSKDAIKCSAKLAFGILRVGLRRHKDANVFPMIHIYFLFIWSLSQTTGAMDYIDGLIPWSEIVQFLNHLSAGKSLSSAAVQGTFPAAERERPILEDFLVRGQIYALYYYPTTFFSDAAMDQEEKDRELPSMTETRNLRVRWLGHQMAIHGQYISYDEKPQRYAVTQRAKNVQEETAFPPLEWDIAMPDVDDRDYDSLNKSPGSPRKGLYEKLKPSQESSSGLPSIKVPQILKREV